MPSGSVLLLDTDRTSAELASSALTAAGYPVETVTDPDVALQAAGGHDLIVIGTVKAAAPAAEICRQIRTSPSLAGIPILCIAENDTVDDRVAFLEAGADDVMAKPFDARELEARAEALMLRSGRTKTTGDAGRAALPPAANSRLIAFFSPKGGVGTTSILVNVALALRERTQQRVGVLDLDLQWGQVATLLNLKPRHTVAELLGDPQAAFDPQVMRSYAQRHESGVEVFAAPRAPDEAGQVRAEVLGDVLTAASGLYEIVIADAGSVLDERTLMLFTHADSVVVPVYPEIPSLKAVRLLLDLLSETAPDTRIDLVINELFPRPMLRASDVESVVQSKAIAEIPHDAVLFQRAANEGIPIVVSSPRTEVAERLVGLAQALGAETLAEHTPAGREQRRGLFGAILKRT